MRKKILAIAFLTALAATSCNSDQATDGYSDSILTDTSFIDTSKVDTANQVDTAARSNTLVDTASLAQPVPEAK